MRIWPLNVIIENYDFYKSENITSQFTLTQPSMPKTTYTRMDKYISTYIHTHMPLKCNTQVIHISMCK